MSLFLPIVLFPMLKMSSESLWSCSSSLCSHSSECADSHKLDNPLLLILFIHYQLTIYYMSESYSIQSQRISLPIQIVYFGYWMNCSSLSKSHWRLCLHWNCQTLFPHSSYCSLWMKRESYSLPLNICSHFCCTSGEFPNQLRKELHWAIHNSTLLCP